MTFYCQKTQTCPRRSHCPPKYCAPKIYVKGKNWTNISATRKAEAVNSVMATLVS